MKTVCKDPERKRIVLSRPGLFFAALLAVEAALALWLVCAGRVPRGHDGFQYFALQHYFLNQAVSGGDVPRWMPFLVQGAVGTWWHVLQAGLLQNVFCAAARFLAGVPFISLFHLGILADHLLLITGCWLLCGRFYASVRAKAFVTLTVAGSAVWTDQPWWNFHLYYAIPLILHLFHRFLETGRWRNMALGANLLALQAFGNPPYFLPVTAWIVFFYFVFFALCRPGEFARQIRALRRGRSALTALAVSFFSFYLVCRFFGAGTRELVHYGGGRNADGSNALDFFMNYGAGQGPFKWLELVTGVSPFSDYTVYLGFVAVSFLPLGFWQVFRKRNGLHFVLLAFLLVLFGSGTPVSAFFYSYWPFMKYFRHLGYLAPAVKLFLCFISGFGIEFLLSRGREPLSVKPRGVLAFSALALAAVSAALFFLSRNYDLGFELARNWINREFSLADGTGFAGFKFYNILREGTLPVRLMLSSGFALLTAVLLFVFPLVKKRTGVFFWGGFLCVQFLDIYSYKAMMIYLKTKPLTPELVSALTFRPLPFEPRRSLTGDVQNWPERLKEENSRARIPDDLIQRYGSLNWWMDAFLMRSETGSHFRVDHVPRALDHLIRAYGGRTPGWRDRGFDGAGAPAGFIFPGTHPAALKAAGVTEDKIQFFSRAHLKQTEEEILRIMTDNGYAGDQLFVLPPEGWKQAFFGLDNPGPAAGERLSLAYSVRFFDSNRLAVETDTAGRTGAWLFYSDVWHPFWKARVNGRTVPVYRANAAYKAVRLDPGKNEVLFYFESGLMTWASRFFGWNAIFWTVFLILLMGRIVFRKTDRDIAGYPS